MKIKIKRARGLSNPARTFSLFLCFTFLVYFIRLPHQPSSAQPSTAQHSTGVSIEIRWVWIGGWVAYSLVYLAQLLSKFKLVRERIKKMCVGNGKEKRKENNLLEKSLLTFDLIFPNVVNNYSADCWTFFLFSWLAAAAGLLWQAMGILRARVKFLVFHQQNRRTGWKNRELPEIHQFQNRNINRREKCWGYLSIYK